MVDPSRERAALKKYIGLMESFVEGQVSVGSFESEFLNLFKNDDHFFSPVAFQALDHLFAELDDFPPETTPGQPDDSEPSLRATCAKTLNVLRGI